MKSTAFYDSEDMLRAVVQVETGYGLSEEAAIGGQWLAEHVRRVRAALKWKVSVFWIGVLAGSSGTLALVAAVYALLVLFGANGPS